MWRYFSNDREDIMMRKGRFTRIAIGTMLTVLVSFAVTVNISNAGEKPKFIKVAGSSLAGTWFRISAMSAAILNQKIKGTIFSATLGGGLTNIKRIESGQLEMGLAMTSGLGFARYGTGPFKGSKKKNVAVIGVMYKNPYHLVVRKNSPIQSAGDLAGKQIAVGKSGWSTELYARTLLEAYDLNYKKIKSAGGKIHFVGWGPMTRLFKDKRIDAAFYATAIPVPQLLDITTVHPIRVLGIDNAKRGWFKKNYPAYFEMPIPKGAYKGHDKGVITMGDSVTMTIQKNIDPDLGYQITKTLFENTKVLAKVHKKLKGMTPEKALAGVKMPLHRGAARYFKEKGISIPAEIMP